MNIGVLGTGQVGATIASKLISLGHRVMMGSRTATSEKAAEWVGRAGSQASQGTFADAARHGELVFNCTHGASSLEAIRAAGEMNLRGKILVDLANPLDFSKGMPPSLTVANTDSLGEQIQRAFPETRVVKALNTVNVHVMVNPERIAGEHHVFVCGNDAAAKSRVTELLQSFGWKAVLDLGDITCARGTEAYLLLWVRLWAATGSSEINIRVVRP